MFATTEQFLFGIGLGVLLSLAFIGILILLIKRSGISVSSPLSLIVIALSFLMLTITNTKMVGLIMEYNRNDNESSKINQISNSFIDQFAQNDDVRYLAQEYLPEGTATLDGIASLVKDPVVMIRERMLSRIWWKVFWSAIIILIAYVICLVLNGGFVSSAPSRTYQGRESRSSHGASSRRETSHRTSSERYSSRHSSYRKR